MKAPKQHCSICGAGYREYLACEETDCKMEIGILTPKEKTYVRRRELIIQAYCDVSTKLYGKHWNAHRIGLEEIADAIQDALAPEMEQ